MAWDAPGAVTSDARLSTSRRDDSARTFMNRVYRWMVGGIGMSAVTAAVVMATPALFGAVRGLYLPLIVAELGLVVAFSFLAHKVSGPVAAAMFLGYAFLNGLTFALIFSMYQLGSVVGAFGSTTLMFVALSVYGTVTKKDLSAWGTFLIMGLFGIVLASVVNLFLASSALSFVTSCAAVLVFAGLTAWDTQKLREMHASSGYASGGALAVRGALVLYLDFINLFLALLRLFGRRR